VHHQWEHSSCAYLCSKFPNAREGKMADMPKSTLIFQFELIFGPIRDGYASHACKLPIAPMGKCLVDMPISILIFYDGCCLDLPARSTCYLCLKLQKFPSPRWEIHVCSLYAGRRCQCLGWWHSVNRELPDLLQHSCQCACSRSKFPIAPMGNSRFARCLQGGGVAVRGGTATISSCTISGNTAGWVRAHPQKFPMPQWDALLLCPPS
jgi:hypothetical protein